MDDWGSFISDLAGKASDAYTANRQYDVAQLQLQSAAVQQATAAQAAKISPTMLMLGAAALVAVLVLSER